MMPLFAQEDDGPDLFRIIATVAAVVIFALFGWISEKIKKAERRQQTEDQERYQHKRAEAMSRRPTTAQARPQPSPPRRAEKIHRYQPQIPAAPAPPDWRSPQQESEDIVVAQDVTTPAAISRQARHQQLQRQHLRAQADRRAQLLAQARQRREAAALRAKRAAQAAQDQAAAQAKAARSLHDGDLVTAELVPTAVDLPETTQISVSHAKLRQAVVWSEILGPPRAMRDYSFSY